MSFKINLDGLDKLRQGLNDINDTKSIKLDELMPPSFIAASSKFKNIQALFDASPFKIETVEDLKAIPDADWDAYIAEKTTYPSWNEMRHAALAQWTKEKLNLG